MSRRSAELLLEDILEAAEKIGRYTARLNKEDFTKDEKTIDAVVRNLQIIGEAASRLPPVFRQEHQHIPWPKIVGLRNRVIHQYFGVDSEIVWEIVRSDLPALKEQLANLL